MALVGGFKPSEKYEFVNFDDYSQDMESHKSHVPVTTNQLLYIYINHPLNPNKSPFSYGFPMAFQPVAVRIAISKARPAMPKSARAGREAGPN